MITRLTSEGYSQTQRKLADLEQRLAEIERRTDLSPDHKWMVVRSYQKMMARYRVEMELYQAASKSTIASS